MECKDHNYNCINCPNANSSAFSSLTEEQMAKVTEQQASVHFKKGQIVMHEGNKPNGVYCITKGKCKVPVPSEEGLRTVQQFPIETRRDPPTAKEVFHW